MKYVTPIWDRLQHKLSSSESLSNISWLVVDRVLRITGELLVGIWLARYLGPEKYGELYYVINIYWLIAPMVSLGTMILLPSEINKRPEDAHTITSSVFALSSLVSILCGLALILSADLLADPSSTAIRPMLLILSGGIFIRAIWTFEYWLNAHLQSKQVVIARNIGYLGALMLKVAAIIVQAPLVVFALLVLVELIVNAIILLGFYFHHGSHWRAFRPSLTEMRRIVSAAFPIFISTTAILVFNRADQVMIPLLIGGSEGTQELGIYVAAVRLSEGWNFLPVAVYTTMLPILTQHYQRDQVTYYALAQQTMRSLVLTGYLVMMLTALLAAPAVNFLYGESYRDATGIVIIMLGASFSVFTGIIRDAMAQAENLLVYTTYATLLGGFTNILLNMWLIPRLGAAGAAWASLVSYFIVNIVSTALFKPFRRYWRIQIGAIFYPNPFSKKL